MGGQGQADLNAKEGGASRPGRHVGGALLVGVAL